MPIEQDLEIVRRLKDEVWNQGRLEVANELLAEDLVNHDTTHPDVHNRVQFIQYVQEVRRAFPDFEVSTLDTIQQNDKIVHRWVTRGTHEGEFMGIPPTRREGTVNGITIYRLENGRVAEMWWAVDFMPMLHLAGIIPTAIHA